MEKKLDFLQSPRDVIFFLQSEGFRISKTSFYNHMRSGKLRPDRQGRFPAAAVLAYASNFLKRLDGSQKPQMEALQRQKMAAEVRKTEAQAAAWNLKAKVAEGLYVEKSAVAMAFAARASFLKNDLQTFLRKTAPEIVDFVGGDPSKTPDLIQFLDLHLGRCLGRYANRDFIAQISNEEIALPDDEN